MSESCESLPDVIPHQPTLNQMSCAFDDAIIDIPTERI
jgi:hypothetical protein